MVAFQEEYTTPIVSDTSATRVRYLTFGIYNERERNLYSENGRTCDTEKELGNLTLVKMNAVSVVVWGGKRLTWNKQSCCR